MAHSNIPSSIVPPRRNVRGCSTFVLVWSIPASAADPALPHPSVIVPDHQQTRSPAEPSIVNFCEFDDVGTFAAPRYSPTLQKNSASFPTTSAKDRTTLISGNEGTDVAPTCHAIRAHQGFAAGGSGDAVGGSAGGRGTRGAGEAGGQDSAAAGPAREEIARTRAVRRPSAPATRDPIDTAMIAVQIAPMAKKVRETRA